MPFLNKTVRNSCRFARVARLIGGQPFEARLHLQNVTLACRIGRNGLTSRKREGDGATPLAILRPIRLFYRKDRRFPPKTLLPLRPLCRDDGWCDERGHGQYNRLVSLPFQASHETMHREDRQYDVVIELDWNRKPRIQGRGSAIFLHLTNIKFRGTAGCLAVAPQRMEWLVARLSPKTRISFGVMGNARRK